MSFLRRIARNTRKPNPLILVSILAMVTLSVWSFASPVGSSPDDDFHLASIWCSAGARDGLCEPAPQSDERVVPKDLVVTAECYAHNPNESAACQGKDFGTHPNTAVTSDRGNFAGLYPPVFYAALSIFAGTNIEISVLSMRIFASLFFVAMVTGLFLLLPLRRRPALVWSTVITMVPLGLFIVASTNPSGWAVLSAATLWVALLGYFETTGWRKVGLGGFAVLSTVIGAGSRADAAAFAGVAIVAVLIVAMRKSRSFVLSSILPAALLVIAVAFYLSARQSAAGSAGLEAGGVGPSPSQVRGLVVYNLLNVPDLWVGAFGHWGLGWLDTAMPAVVWVAAFGCFVVAMYVGLRKASWRRSLASIWVLAGLWIFPTIVLVQTGAIVGGYVQPRYILPLLVLLAGIALSNHSDPTLGLSRRELFILAAPLAAAQSIALLTNIRRYVSGADTGSLNLDSHVAWWWHIPVSPMAMWSIGSLAFSGLLLVLVLAVTRAKPAVPTGRGSEPFGETSESRSFITQPKRREFPA